MVANVIGQLAGLDKSAGPQRGGTGLNCPSLGQGGWAGLVLLSRLDGPTGLGSGSSRPGSQLSPSVFPEPRHPAKCGDPRAPWAWVGQDLLPQRSQT